MLCKILSAKYLITMVSRKQIRNGGAILLCGGTKNLDVIHPLMYYYAHIFKDHTHFDTTADICMA